MKLLLIILLSLSLYGASAHRPSKVTCETLLHRAISDLNEANSNGLDYMGRYSTRSLANLEMFKVCIEIDGHYNSKKLKKALWKLK